MHPRLPLAIECRALRGGPSPHNLLDQSFSFPFGLARTSLPVLCRSTPEFRIQVRKIGFEDGATNLNMQISPAAKAGARDSRM